MKNLEKTLECRQKGHLLAQTSEVYYQELGKTTWNRRLFKKTYFYMLKSILMLIFAKLQRLFNVVRLSYEKHWT